MVREAFGGHPGGPRGKRKKSDFQTWKKCVKGNFFLATERTSGSWIKTEPFFKMFFDGFSPLRDHSVLILEVAGTKREKKNFGPIFWKKRRGVGGNSLGQTRG